MTLDEIFIQLVPIIETYLPQDVSKEDIKKESDLTSELNINSAHLVDVVLDVEDKFGIEFTNADMEKLRTVNDAMIVIHEKLANAV